MRVKREEVLRVYSGKTHKCMCGCSGKYYCDPENRAEVEKLRGYAVSDDEVNAAMVTRVVNALNKAPVEDVREEKALDGTKVVSAVVGSRVYVAYMK